jgi:hypothetical protein
LNFLESSLAEFLFLDLVGLEASFHDICAKKLKPALGRFLGVCMLRSFVMDVFVFHESDTGLYLGYFSDN